MQSKKLYYIMKATVVFSILMAFALIPIGAWIYTDTHYFIDGKQVFVVLAIVVIISLVLSIIGADHTDRVSRVCQTHHHPCYDNPHHRPTQQTYSNQ